MRLLSLADEIPIPPDPSVDHWSENFFFVGYDADLGLHFCLHLGRWPKNRSLWREQLWIFFPDGSMGIARQYGARPSERGPSGLLADLICEEPGRRWRLHYAGPIRRASSDELNRGSLREGEHQYVELDLVFAATSEIWDFADHMQQEEWASFHYEQTGVISGTISWDGSSHRINAIGHRDHSRGARTFQKMKSAGWLQGHFPNGRAFALVDVRRDDHLFGLAAVFQDGKVYPARYEGLPVLSSVEDLPREYVLDINSELGRMEVKTTIGRLFPFTLDAVFEHYYGKEILPISKVMAFVGPTEVEWSGIRGVGYNELSFGVN